MNESGSCGLEQEIMESGRCSSSSCQDISVAGLFSPMTKECGDLLFPRDGAVNLQH
jgi:hypothetical protein